MKAKAPEVMRQAAINRWADRDWEDVDWKTLVTESLDAAVRALAAHPIVRGAAQLDELVSDTARLSRDAAIGRAVADWQRLMFAAPDEDEAIADRNQKSKQPHV